MNYSSTSRGFIDDVHNSFSTLNITEGAGSSSGRLRGRGRGRGRGRDHSSPSAVRRSGSGVAGGSEPNAWMAKFFDKVVKHKGKEAITSQRDAESFLRAVVEQKREPKEVLAGLSTEKGTEGTVQALSMNTSASFYKMFILPFFRFLGHRDFSMGTCKRPLERFLQKIATDPFFLQSLGEAILYNYISATDDIDVIGWFVLVILRNQENDDEKLPYLDVLEAAITSRCSLALKKSISNAARVNDEHRFRNPSLLSFQNASPGGRHANDKVDFRRIDIVPSMEEVRCQREPYLPRANDEPLFDDPVTCLLDRQFRLVREDFVGQLREELQRRFGPNAGGARGRKVLTNAYPCSVFAGDTNNRDSLGLILFTFDQPGPVPRAVRLQAQNAGNNKAVRSVVIPECKKFWEDETRWFADSSLVCCVRNGDPLCLATVSLRDPVRLATLEPTIGLHFGSESDLSIILQDMGKGIPSYELVQLSSAAFSYTPVLKRLQDMNSLPLEKQILSGRNENLPIHKFETLYDVADHVLMANENTNLQHIFNTPDELRLDLSQRRAVGESLKRRVGLIQGPPGTGKSFCGSLLVKAILEYTTETVLCVCFTNHALDQFLEDLLNLGVPEKDVVRLGSRKKISDRIKGLQLNSREGRLDRADFEFRRGLESDLGQLSRAIRKTAEDLNHAQTKSVDNLWPVMEVFLDKLGYDMLAPFRSNSVDGFRVINARGKELKSKDLWEMWCHGASPPTSVMDDPTGLWRLSPVKRRRQYEKWRENLVADLRSNLVQTLQRYDKTMRERWAVNDNRSLEVLKKRRVIGCTTMKAAKHADLLQAVHPECLCVEEAGEILESHVLTSLNNLSEHLILIGDHQQLRPKVNLYNLQVESGAGFNLNRSLFERLVLEHFPCEKLALQHRMRPQISDLVRQLVYPDLRDHPKVHQYPAEVRGLRDTLIFMKHDHPENDDQDVIQRGDEGTSKVNKAESLMVAKVVQYLVKWQGYDKSSIVVLTPYLSQLRTLRTDLRKVDLSVVLGQLDVQELRQQDVQIEDAALKHGVRVSTVDNFQGEEADIVIISLVRSNPHCRIGFLRERERVNVLLSRARHGMIILGNANVLTKASSEKGKVLWTQLLTMLQRGGHVYEGIPTICRKHNTGQLLRTHKDFDRLVPKGGCTVPCPEILQCGHRCPLPCHFSDHQRVRCEERLVFECAANPPHKSTYVCGRTPKCPTCAELLRLEEKRKQEEKQQRLRLAEAEASREAVRARVAEAESVVAERLRREDRRIQAVREDAMRGEVHREKLLEGGDEEVDAVRGKTTVCCACSYEYRFVDGINCPAQDHFFCDDCFMQCVKSAVGDLNGRVTCPMKPCQLNPFTDVLVAGHVDEETYNAYMDKRTKATEKQLAKKMEADMKKKLEAEIARLREMDELGRAVLQSVRHIREEILNLKCPRCGQVFRDFDGCWALTCSNVACKCGFCALCLKDCGSDAHGHVAQCTQYREGGGGMIGGVFGSTDDFEKVQKRRRQQLVRQFLNTLAGEVRRLTWKECERDFKDLGLDIPNEDKA
eukprot:Rmarinus@m.14001